jgi:hypothetical protein
MVASHSVQDMLQLPEFVTASDKNYGGEPFGTGHVTTARSSQPTVLSRRRAYVFLLLIQITHYTFFVHKVPRLI